MFTLRMAIIVITIGCLGFMGAAANIETGSAQISHTNQSASVSSIKNLQRIQEAIRTKRVLAASDKLTLIRELESDSYINVVLAQIDVALAVNVGLLDSRQIRLVYYTALKTSHSPRVSSRLLDGVASMFDLHYKATSSDSRRLDSLVGMPSNPRAISKDERAFIVRFGGRSARNGGLLMARLIVGKQGLAMGDRSWLFELVRQRSRKAAVASERKLWTIVMSVVRERSLHGMIGPGGRK
jgi:hypothetical protein